MTAAGDVIRVGLTEASLDFAEPQPDHFFVKLPGTNKLFTNCWLIVGQHGLLIEAFVCRQPDENHQELYSFLLKRNAKMFAVSFALDAAGDVYLVGRLPLTAVTPEELDRLLGAVLQYADETFNTLLEIGFISSIRREWAWREKRGESMANLQAFARFASPES